MRTVKFFWQYFKDYTLSFIIVIVMMIASTILQVLFPIYVGQAVQHLVELGNALANGGEKNQLLAAFASLMTKLFLTFLCLSISSLIYMVLMSRVISHSTNEMRKGLFGKLAKLTVSFFDRHQDGDILSRFTSDLDNILQALNESMIQVLSNILLYLVLVIIMFRQNARLAWITVASTPLAIVVLVVIVKLARKYTNLQQKEVGQLNAYMDETISGQKAVIVQGMQEEVIKGFLEQNDRVRSATFKGRAFSGLLFPIMNGMSLINTAIVIFVGSAVLLSDPNVETAVAVGLITTYAQFSQQYYQPIIQIAASWGSLQLAFTGADRIQEMFDAPEEVRPENAPAFTELTDSVEIKHVDFSYVEGKPILKDVSIFAPKGKMTAVVGPTGSGKTTIMNLLNRFYDVDSGSIEFDGRDIRDYELDSLRSHVGIVLQDSVLFSGTIRDNIRFGVPDASQEMVETAARATHIHDYIESLPDKYDTLVDDDQNIFSTGQKQLISIARTLLTDPQVLILDEATSNVDTVTESKIQQAMEAIVAGRTSFVIAHRLKTILNADQIIVLKDGEVIEQGDHHQLLQLGGFYSELYHNQFVFE
ncbi:ABC transporter ATP-binding protein [Streptococcus sp. 27098_8_75]|jgi:ATP-binding permease|uniref:ABC transporter ATP-binding protein n=1 Tax=Streptococcus TaxID=1301 RepID=UPI0005F330FA|nr:MULTISPECIES: ABC transporter ATP-binding protein [Streptococcus]KJU97895.1 ABC transporter ATP-binding protein/permease [Streptococcus gordonii]MCC3174202.1 ABC transporter transmembrane region family protein [Streptococcus gordonii]MCG4822127.1 ABC transporter ATP-binding protein/permease [Streptococcus gordonii]MCG4848820.1 ABC transporter ATP-binding protein/permease [Streptococcus gordonii]MCY7132715.1 ABC transporter ATP-binding protein/permease [Streptococcus gordonii]